MDEFAINVVGLRKYFPVSKKYSQKGKAVVKAVDDVSFQVERRKTLGLVGESGCGKTTIGKTLLGFLKPTAGKAFFEGKELFSLKRKEFTQIRWKLQMIFQDPLSSLDPRWTVRSILGEPFMIHRREKRKQREELLVRTMELVGLGERHLDAYPHEFSGGQLQRIVIARAMVTHPTLVILDEPTSALDVSVQGQILNLLQDLQREFGTTYIFISHDLSVIKHMSDQIAVMYLGKIVEMATSLELFSDPLHAYTKALISSIPDPTIDSEEVILEGEVPSSINPPSGCVFHPRCLHREKRCSHSIPTLCRVSDDHYVSCLLFQDGGEGEQ